jgi:hypothetical protein
MKLLLQPIGNKMKYNICNVWHKTCTLTIKKGVEFVCPECGGHGGFVDSLSYKQKTYSVIRCILCNGEGKIDWIKNINRIVDENRVGRTTAKYVSIKCHNNKCRKIYRIYQIDRAHADKCRSQFSRLDYDTFRLRKKDEN